MSKTFKLSAIFLLTVIMLLVFRIVGGFITLPDNIYGWLFSFFFQVGMLGVLPYALYIIFIKKDTLAFFDDMRIKVKIHPASYLVAVVIGFLVFYLNTIISAFSYTFLTAFGYTFINGVGTIYSSPEVLVFEILTSAMMPAIFEEICDRGMLLSIMEDVKSDRLKMIVVGLMFGLLHQNVVQFASTAFAGIVFCYMALKMRSIVPGMIVHFMNNFLIIMLNFSEQRTGSFDKLYTSIYSFTFSGIAQLFVMIVAVSFMLYTLLIQLKKLNAPYREKHEELPPNDKHLGMIAKEKVMKAIIEATKQMENDDFSYVFGESDEKPASSMIIDLNKLDLEEKEQAAQNEKTADATLPKLNHNDYLLLYLSIGVTILTTLFTFIWGLLR